MMQADRLPHPLASLRRGGAPGGTGTWGWPAFGRWLAGRRAGAAGHRADAVPELGADASVDAGALLVAAGAEPSVRLTVTR